MNARGWIGDDVDDDVSYPMHGTGTATTLPIDAENDPAQRVREIAREVTGRDIPEPVKPRIGFLP